MSSLDRYANALSDFYDACMPGNSKELQEVIYVLELGLASALSTLNGLQGHPASETVSEYYAEALKNLTWLVLPNALPNEQVSIDRAITAVCALSVAKAHVLDKLDPENKLVHRNEFIETVQRCCVAALISAVVMDYRDELTEELMDSIRSEYLEDLSSINKKFVDRWSNYFLENYGIGIRGRNAEKKE